MAEITDTLQGNIVGLGTKLEFSIDDIDTTEHTKLESRETGSSLELETRGKSP